MITVKAFEKGLRCRGFKYEIGKIYTCDKDKVRICEYGFHASANCDLSDTLNYYPNIKETEYCLVDINVIDKTKDKVVGDRIKILKKLEFPEIINYDKTGEWCYRCMLCMENIDVKLLQQAVIKKDKTGEWCYNFAHDVKGADIDLLQDAVIKKDKTGKWCYRFAKNIKGADIKLLQQAIIEKDKIGEWCYLFIRDIESADVGDFMIIRCPEWLRY